MFARVQNLPPMPNDLLFTVTGSTATPAQPVTLAEAGLRERRDLQEWVLAHPHILGDDIVIVTFEFDRWWASSAAPGDRLDVLALGADGRLVVAELKRDKAPDTVEMQAIKYAAMASRFTTEALASQHARFLTQRGTPTTEDEALQHLVAHAGDLDVETLRRPRIVIVAREFPPVLTATAVWLTEMGLDLTLVRVQAYRTQNETLLSVTQLFPVKDVEEFTVSPRLAEVKAVEEKRQRQKDVSTTNRLVTGHVLEDGTTLRLRPEAINDEVRAQIEAWLQNDPKRKQARWYNTAGTPLVWEADGQHYSPSGLAALVVQQAAGVTRSIRGGNWWVTEDGRDLVELAQELGSARERLYLEFWTRFAERVGRDHPEWVATHGQPTEWNWFQMASPIRGSFYSAAFMRERRMKFELYVDVGDADKNRRIINGLLASRSSIEEVFGAPLQWNLPDERHRYGSVSALGDGDITDGGRHDEFSDWFIRSGEKLREALDSRASVGG